MQIPLLTALAQTMIQSNRSAARRKNIRKGSIYIAVLGTAMIVALLGLAALTAQRVQRKSQQGARAVHQARLNARTALKMGMLIIENDPDWRYNFRNGVWEANVSVQGTDGGTYTLKGTDPSDGDFTDDSRDPLVLTGTGRMGDAVQKMQITLVLEKHAFSCLEVAMHLKEDVEFKDTTVWCDQIISSNKDVKASNATVNSDVEAHLTVTGLTYKGDTTEDIDQRELPDATTVFDYYKTNGTWINKDAIPLGYANALGNPGIEDGTSPWETSDGTEPGVDLDCDIARDVTEAHRGDGSLKTTNREAWNAGPIQYLTDVIKNGVKYNCEVYVRMPTPSNVKVRLVLNTQSTGEGDQWHIKGETDVKDSDGWKLVHGDFTPSWTGTLNRAFLKIETKSGYGEPDFYIDDAVFKQEGNERTIDRQVLSPKNNPFGPTTNPQGIYVIDLDGQKIFIRDSRIVGTLVLIEPNSGSRIGDGGALNWQPAISSFPALLVSDSEPMINPSDAGLVEAALGTNFNPPGTPYEGLGEDTDQNDTYRSTIKGLIYSVKKIHFENHPVITGVVIGDDKVEIHDELTLFRNPIHMISPPPGFGGPEETKILLGSAKKAVD